MTGAVVETSSARQCDVGSPSLTTRSGQPDVSRLGGLRGRASRSRRRKSSRRPSGARFSRRTERGRRHAVLDLRWGVEPLRGTRAAPHARRPRRGLGRGASLGSRHHDAQHDSRRELAPRGRGRRCDTCGTARSESFILVDNVVSGAQWVASAMTYDFRPTEEIRVRALGSDRRRRTLAVALSAPRRLSRPARR